MSIKNSGTIAQLRLVRCLNLHRRNSDQCHSSLQCLTYMISGKGRLHLNPIEFSD